jgi:hypothetical protein
MENNIIYHYCTVETFLNIIKNHTLRLSDLCSSNDKAEMKILLGDLENEILNQYRKRKDFLKSVIYGMDIDEAFEFILKRLIYKMDNNINQMLFGICFSEKGDLLGQWREYADKGTGIAIGFNIEWLLKLGNNKLFKFSKVSYDYSKDSTLIKEHAARIYSEMIQTIENGGTKKLIDESSNLPYMIYLQKECLFFESVFQKGKEYKSEEEWRLILDDEETRKDYPEWDIYYNWKNKDLRFGEEEIYSLIPNGMEFMVKNGRIIPFLDLKIDFDKSNLPIEEVIIGPNCKVNILDIYHLLQFYGFNGEKIKIEKSKSSYRI